MRTWETLGQHSPKLMDYFDDDIISGSVVKSVWKLAWPVIITQLVAGIHGIIDHVLVGHYVGYEAQAAIGVSWQLFLVIVVFLSSLFHGMNILVARYSGRRDRESVNRVVFEVLVASAYLLLLVVAPIGYLFSPVFLDWLHAAPEVQEHARPYIRILFTSSLPLFLMFILSGAFQSSGNPKIPLYLGILTTLANIGISFVLIVGVGPFPRMGAVGAAIGTCLAPLPGVLIGLWLIVSHRTIIGRPARVGLFPDLGVLRPVAWLGIPAGIQAVLLNIGGVFLMGFILSLEESTEALAAYTICYAQLFSIVTWTGFGIRAACAAVMGQNMGAGKNERGKQAVYVGAAIGFMWAVFFGVFYWTIPDVLLGWFGIHDPVVLSIGADLLKYLAFSGIFIAVTLALTGGLQGAGDTRKPMYIAFITQIVISLGICTVYQQLGRLTTDVIWMAILVAHVSRLVLTYIVFFRGRWKHIAVEIKQKA